jgi:anti-sigma regulatory factor (Ser/Thr protein kinase)
MSWQDEPGSVAGLAALRRRLRTALDDHVLPAGTDDGERLMLVVEELVSNALRHGGPPVGVTLTTLRLGWLVAVSDTATDQAPVPALDRDPADGGMGLALVGRLCRAHGWMVEGDHKIVWARVPFLEPVPADRARAVRCRARSLVAGLTDTAARTAGILDALAATQDAAGRADLARRYRGAATRARLDAERARQVALISAPPAPRLPVG